MNNIPIHGPFTLSSLKLGAVVFIFLELHYQFDRPFICRLVDTCCKWDWFENSCRPHIQGTLDLQMNQMENHGPYANYLLQWRPMWWPCREPLLQIGRGTRGQVYLLSRRTNGGKPHWWRDLLSYWSCPNTWVSLIMVPRGKGILTWLSFLFAIKAPCWRWPATVALTWALYWLGVSGGGLGSVSGFGADGKRLYISGICWCVTHFSSPQNEDESSQIWGTQQYINTMCQPCISYITHQFNHALFILGKVPFIHYSAISLISSNHLS